MHTSEVIRSTALKCSKKWMLLLAVRRGEQGALDSAASDIGGMHDAPRAVPALARQRQILRQARG